MGAFFFLGKSLAGRFSLRRILVGRREEGKRGERLFEEGRKCRLEAGATKAVELWQLFLLADRLRRRPLQRQEKPKTQVQRRHLGHSKEMAQC